MATKTYNLATTQIRVEIEPGIAVITTNNPEVTKNLFKESKKKDKKGLVFWDEEHKAIINKCPGNTIEEISESFDEIFIKALKAGKKAERDATLWARRQKK